MPTLQVKTGLKLVLKLPEARDSGTGLGRRFWAVFKGPDGVFFLWSDEEILGCHGLMRFYDVLYGLIWMIMVKITGSMGWNGIYLSIGPILSYPILSYPILSIYIYIYICMPQNDYLYEQWLLNPGWLMSSEIGWLYWPISRDDQNPLGESCSQATLPGSGVYLSVLFMRVEIEWNRQNFNF